MLYYFRKANATVDHNYPLPSQGPKGRGDGFSSSSFAFGNILLFNSRTHMSRYSFQPKIVTSKITTDEVTDLLIISWAT